MPDWRKTRAEPASDEIPLPVELSETTVVRHAPLPFLSLACAVGVSSIYLNQPLLLEMAHTFGAQPQQVGLVAVATQVGYACGMLTLVPLGDVSERRGLMMRLFAAAGIALAAVALAPTLSLLVVASLLAGVFASVTHLVVPLAPDLAAEGERGKAIGTVMTGLLLGILLARTFAGWLSHLGGWRWVFGLAALLNLAFALLLRRVLPELPARQAMGYVEAIRSLWTLVRGQPALRSAAVVGALVFAAFSGFWTTLAFLLHTHFGLGAAAAGTFGLVGASGALAASWTGRMADRHGSRIVASGGITLFLLSYLWLWGVVQLPLGRLVQLAGLVVGVVALDLGTQCMQVANQTRIFGLVPSARSRINTVYMTMYFIGGAGGSLLSSLAWTHWGWTGVCALGVMLLSLALARHLLAPRATAARA